jgi:hypothetical protein
MKSTTDISSKLLRVERTINIYDTDDELIEEIEIDIPLEILQNIIVANDDDPLLYDGYELNEVQLQKLNDNLQNKLLFDLKQYSYVLVAGGIYNW